jgi:hypothetical protein
MTQDGKTRGEKSAVIVERLVRGQLRVMGCECFDIGIKRDTGEMILREGPARSRQPSSGYANENAKGGHIYVRPAGTHSLSLIDDLSAEAIERMKVEGFEPALVVETSPNNFQAWLNHGQVLEAPMSTRAVGGVHQSKARAAVAFGDAAVRAVAIRHRACLFEGDRVSCGHPSERRRAADAGRGATEAGPT